VGQIHTHNTHFDVLELVRLRNHAKYLRLRLRKKAQLIQEHNNNEKTH
jgi:hypothetical protein